MSDHFNPGVRAARCDAWRKRRTRQRCFGERPVASRHRRLIAADNIGRMTLWDVESGLEVLTLRGHPDRIYALAFSADGRFLASASRDGTAKVWDATTLDPSPASPPR